MKKKIILCVSLIVLIVILVFSVVLIKKSREDADSSNSANMKNTEGIDTVLTLEDEIKDDTIWCGTFQLIWNDLKNDLAKQDIVFLPKQLKVVENLNKETFKKEYLTDKYYYKKIGIPSLELKKEIENAIKDKFNEKSNILDNFEWNGKSENDYFLYVMLKKEFEFEKAFEDLDKGAFGNFNNISYFGIKDEDSNEVLKQVEVLYYDSKDDFAIKLKTKQEDEVILCKNPKGETFNEIYDKINERRDDYKGDVFLQEGEKLKVPNIKINQKKEFKEIENNSFYFLTGKTYHIDKAIQTIEFDLDRKGGRIKSEAGMMALLQDSISMRTERTFYLDDTFAIFLKEEGKDKPYFAGKITDITKFQ